MKLRHLTRSLFMALVAVLFVFATGCSTGTRNQPVVSQTPPPTSNDFEPEDDFERDDTYRDDGFVTDGEIHDEIHEALERAPGVDASHIHVSVENGSVRLWGTVDSERARQSAHDLAHSVEGVHQVFLDDLRVGY